MKEPLFNPKLASLWKAGISRDQWLKDITSGLIVGVVALPLAIAFAIASGVSPDKGLATAIVAGFIISALGGSRVQIGGPTGAFIVIIYAIVQQYGVSGLTIATFMAGFILMIMGLARMGNLLKYIPYPLIVGFTSGIAVIIFSSQIKDFFGLSIDQLPADFIAKWTTYVHHFNHISWISTSIAVGTVVISLNFQRMTTKIPGPLVAILVSTLAVYFFQLPVTTIESSFGNIPNHLSIPGIPHIEYSTVKALIQPAFAIALLGGIESLLSATVADGMIGGRHRSNTELIAQGIANCFSSMFGGIPATGAIARTVTNVKNGGRTPIAGITHAVVLLLVMLLLAPLAKLIPMACLAGILMVIAYHMSEWRQFRSLLKSNKLDVLILLVTFFLTVLFDLVMAIEVGIVLSGFVLMKRMSESLHIQKVTDLLYEQTNSFENLFEDELHSIPDGVAIFEINGALFFGVAQTFQDTIHRLQKNPKVLILRMRNVPFIDATGIFRIREMIKQYNQEKVSVLLSGVNPSVKKALEENEIHSVLRVEHIYDNIDAALHAAKFILKQQSGPGKK